MAKTLLSEAYPSADNWRTLVEQFSPEAIAHKLLLSHVPFVFREEPLKFALFRHTIAEAFDIEPTNVFIVGSAMSGRSLKGSDIDKNYSTDSDIDTLLVSERLFTNYVMKSLEWLRDVTLPKFEKGKRPLSPHITADTTKYIGWLSSSACKGIWRPDSLPNDAEARIEFFGKFNHVSLKTLGLQLSDDTVSKVNGRVARSFADAVTDLSSSIAKLRREFRNEEVTPAPEDAIDLMPSAAS
ncbi:MAG: hypothetical protein JO001_15015 [Alphaproteobacteria bacterium]|nr:hypothetical protein [Alphaproteobacteria bacterium]